MGVVVNIQRYSLGDGPGIRTTVFLKGCPLRCLWCANPESQDPKPEIGHRESMCRHCGKCLQACKNGAISLADGRIRIDRAKCIRCGICVDACLYESMTWYGKEMSADAVVREVCKDEMFYGADGGVTLSGGEVLMQAEYATEILRGCKEAGIGTAIETSGFGAGLDLLLPWLDIILFDIKCVDSARHKEMTGAPSEIIHRNLRLATESGAKVTVRYPMIPGYNDAPGDVEAIAELMAALGLHTAEIMPYHSFGVTKYDALGRPYTVQSETPDSEKLAHAMAAFAAHGVMCTVGGHTAAQPVESDTREPRCAEAMRVREETGGIKNV